MLYNICMKLNRKLTDQQRIAFAKQVEYMYEAAWGSWKHVIGLALLRGIAMGFGIVIGGTILIALLAWLLGSLENIPLLGDLAETARETVEESN